MANSKNSKQKQNCQHNYFCIFGFVFLCCGYSGREFLE